jgi:hypothetical protein
MDLNLYQPATLLLKGGQRVETVEGVYTPQVDEVWHADARFKLLEAEAVRAAQAAMQGRNG